MTAIEPSVVASSPSRSSKLGAALMLILCAASLLALALLLTVPARVERPKAAPPPLPTEPLSVAGAPALGNPNAGVALVEFSDFQCPFCAVFAADTLPALLESYVNTGKVLFVFRHFPLEKLHPLARQLAASAECSHQQGAFWPFHEAIFSQSARLEKSTGASVAASLKLNPMRYAECLAAPGPERVATDAKAGQALGVTGTPTFFVGPIMADGRVRVSRRLGGARRTAEFLSVLNEALLALDSRKLP